MERDPALPVDPAGDSIAESAGEGRATASNAALVSLEVGRVFDVPEAWLVRDSISRASPTARIVLDFRRTAELHDFALAVLVEALTTLDRRVELRGLGKHHQSLLRLLGRPLAARVVADADVEP